MYLFYQNKILKAVFTDIDTMKKNISIYLIKYHLEKKYYQNLEETKNMIKNKLKDLFSEDLYFMENFNNTWYIKVLESNKIYKEIEILNYNTRYTKILVKGANWSKRELSKNLPLIDLDSYY